MSALNEKLYKSTGIHMDLDSAMEAAFDKEVFLRRLIWSLPKGAVHSINTENGKLNAEIISECAERLGLNIEDVLASDGHFSDYDKSIMETLSKIEISVEDLAKVNTLEELLIALANADVKDIKLGANMEIDKTLSLTSGEKTINLNGKTIANANIDILYTEDGKSITSNVDAITVKPGAKLTIEGNTKSKVTVVSGGGSTLYANGGNIVVNGGVYESLQGIEGGKGYSLIYADNNGNIEINDGYFIVNGNTEEQSYQYVLNCKDNVNSIIKVKGGYFFNWNPANHDARTKRPEHPEVVLGDDFADETYEVKDLGTTTLVGHTGQWYKVVRKA